MGSKVLRLLYYYNADPMEVTAISTIFNSYLTGELSKLEPTVVIVEGFKNPYISLGYYQDIDREVDINKCKDYNVIITRRLRMGLGAIFIDKNSATVSLRLPDYENYFKTSSEGYDILTGKVFLYALRRLGVEDAVYVPPNDIRVKGKKICGTGVTVVKERNVAFFDSFTNLRHPDPELPFKVLKIPPEKFKDKEIKKPEEYFASIEIDGKRGAPKPGEFLEAFKEAFSVILGLDLVEGKLNDEERKLYDKYLDLMRSEDFIFRRSFERFIKNLPSNCSYAFHQEKYRKLIQATVAVDDKGIIYDLMITGDYGLSPPDLDEEIVKRIKGLRYNEYESAVKAIRELISKPGYEIIGASVEEFLVPVFKAAEKAYHNK